MIQTNQLPPPPRSASARPRQSLSLVILRDKATAGSSQLPVIWWLAGDLRCRARRLLQDASSTSALIVCTFAVPVPGEPAVVFDAALGGSSLSWTIVQPAVAEFTTACSYDCAGFGWSEGGPQPRTVSRIADELYELLTPAGVRPPYVFAGHSFGALTTRLFAARHPTLIAGLVLIDPAHPEDWVDPQESERARIARGTRLCRHGAIAARLGIASVVSALVSAGALSAARRIAAMASRGGLQRDDEQVLAPATKLPQNVRAALKWMWTQPRFFEALGSQIDLHLHQRCRDTPGSGLRQPAIGHDFRNAGER